MQEVKSGTFEARTREGHQLHVTTAQKEGVSCFGVETVCVLIDRLSHFNIRHNPPDTVHDLFERIVPVELAQCITVLLSKGLFTLGHINSLIHSFPYKWVDKTNCPHLFPQNLQRKTQQGAMPTKIGVSFDYFH